MALPKQRTGVDVKGKDNYNTSSSATHYGKGSCRRGTTKEESKYIQNFGAIDWSVKLERKDTK